MDGGQGSYSNPTPLYPKCPRRECSGPNVQSARGRGDPGLIYLSSPSFFQSYCFSPETDHQAEPMAHLPALHPLQAPVVQARLPVQTSARAILPVWNASWKSSSDNKLRPPPPGSLPPGFSRTQAPHASTACSSKNIILLILEREADRSINVST